LDRAVVFADDSFRKPEPEPSSRIPLGCVERLEKVGATVLRDAGPGVGQSDAYSGPSLPVRFVPLGDAHPQSATLGHGLHGIDDQI